MHEQTRQENVVLSSRLFLRRAFHFLPSNGLAGEVQSAASRNKLRGSSCVAEQRRRPSTPARERAAEGGTITRGRREVKQRCRWKKRVKDGGSVTNVEGEREREREGGREYSVFCHNKGWRVTKAPVNTQ